MGHGRHAYINEGASCDRSQDRAGSSAGIPHINYMGHGWGCQRTRLTETTPTMPGLRKEWSEGECSSFGGHGEFAALGFAESTIVTLGFDLATDGSVKGGGRRQSLARLPEVLTDGLLDDVLASHGLAIALGKDMDCRIDQAHGLGVSRHTFGCVAFGHIGGACCRLGLLGLGVCRVAIVVQYLLQALGTGNANSFASRGGAVPTFAGWVIFGDLHGHPITGHFDEIGFAELYVCLLHDDFVFREMKMVLVQMPMSLIQSSAL